MLPEYFPKILWYAFYTLFKIDEIISAWLSMEEILFQSFFKKIISYIPIYM